MKRFPTLFIGALAIIVGLGASGAHAQLIDESFDAYATGSPPPSPWWNWGTSGTKHIDETVFNGASGKSVELHRTAFDHQAFAIGRTIAPLEGEVDLTYFFRLTGGSTREALCVFGRDSSDNMIAWWVTHGGQFGNAVATYSDIQGWTHIMDISSDAWYGVLLDIDTAAATYDITVWEQDNPTNTATVTDRTFRNSPLANAVDEIQLGDFYASYSDLRSAYVDDLRLVGPVVFRDGFESGDTAEWSGVSP
jgi:hypothetical protein